LEDSLAEAMLSGRINEGDTAIVDVDDNGQVQVVKSVQRDLVLSA